MLRLLGRKLLDSVVTYALLIVLIILINNCNTMLSNNNVKPRTVIIEDIHSDEPAPNVDSDDDDEFWETDSINVNTSELGMYVGAQCELKCNRKLHHVYCDPRTSKCTCDSKYTVILGPTKGCAKPKKLGEKCFYGQTCKYNDPHSTCVQINHNAICTCDQGFRTATHTRPMYRIFCTEDIALVNADLATLLGVTAGIAVLAGLLCMVLHLYAKARYPHHPHMADASITPPMYGIDEDGQTRGISRTSSRNSTRSETTGGTLDSSGSRRESRSRGVVVSASRAGAARAAAILLISYHLNTNVQPHYHKRTIQGSRKQSVGSLKSNTSGKSYSMRRFEKEREQKEKRQQMQTKLAQLHINMASNMAANLAVNLGKHDVTPKLTPTPSPKSPSNSTDGLLPALSELKEIELIDEDESCIVNPSPGTSQQFK